MSTKPIRKVYVLDLGSVRGFSLVEVLTATAVLALILLLMVQITDGILNSTRLQNRQLDSVAAARRALDTITTDFTNGIVTNEVSILLREASPNMPFLALLTNRPPPRNASQHRFLAVQYEYDSQKAKLYRNYKSVSFSDSKLFNEMASSDFNRPDIPLAGGILGFYLEVFTTDESNPIKVPSDAVSDDWATTSDYNGYSVPSGWKALLTPSSSFAKNPGKTTFSIRIWMAATEPQSLDLLEKTGKLSTTLGIFSNHDPRDWRTALDASSLPPAVKSSTRILQRTFPVN
ncbi:MAG: prepilin-type N-terminal cleavage/methylation domain-containing protein [Chthoniobacterales bacterium]|nr:prepilin-type N-terminal cleavage/methylation domain-containing protein [Chthoniobacterales bacterium]